MMNIIIHRIIVIIHYIRYNSVDSLKCLIKYIRMKTHTRAYKLIKLTYSD